jgi:hypothetical protein
MCHVVTMRKTLVPNVPSSAIGDTGLISSNDLLGSAQLHIPAIFRMSRATMNRAIGDGRIPTPLRPNSRCLVWESRVIKALVAELEAQGQL